MVVSTSKQVHILFMKNNLIMARTREHIKTLIFPLLTFILLLNAKLQDNPVWSMIGLYFIPISLMSVSRQVVYSMVEEKQTKQKEIQKIMGVKQSSYVLGWLATNLFRTAVVVVIFLLLSIPTEVMESQFTYSEAAPTKVQLILGYCLFGLSQMAFSYFMSVFFSVPKTAGDISILFGVIGDFLVQLLLLGYVQEYLSPNNVSNPWLVYLLCLFPSTAFTKMIFGNLSNAQTNIQFSNNSALLMMLFDLVLYFTLYVYLDNVIPNEYGTHKSPFFFLKFGKKDKVEQQQQGYQADMSLPLYGNEASYAAKMQDDVSSAIYHEQMNINSNTVRSIEITGLDKSFGEVKAVNGVTISIYQSQLLCLLGHNGAGKTTTISLVTGLVTKDQGSVKFYGKSIDSDLDEIRQFTGICVQRDVLYEELNVEEHLRYYARMKGFEGAELEQEIEYILNKCVLQGEKAKLSKQLSGGNKRKLSLGMALIGKSKVVFLDEPTSGMDPVTRRAIWDILQEVKQEQRTLILTTHHLDEAEVLSERIAIMAKGKLLTVGSADFIKRNFGIGYHLNIFRKRGDDFARNQTPSDWQDRKEQLKKFVKGQIDGAQVNPQTAEDTLTFLLPTQNKSTLLPLFEHLEKDPTITLDLAMTSLEEAFINIGMDEEKFMNRTRRISHQQQHVQEPPKQQEHSEYTDFSSIPIPDCLHEPPSYSFGNQFHACFLRKFYTTRIGKKMVMQFLVPIYFEVIAALLCYLNRDNFHTPEELLAFASIGVTFELAFGMCISAASIAGSPVQEREEKLKYALNVMGCRIVPYWLATMAFDCLVSFFQIVIFIILLAALGITELIVPSLCLVYFATQYAFIGYSYMISWLYTRANMAYKTVFLLTFSCFTLVPVILIIIAQEEMIFWLCALISPIVGMMQAISVGSSFHVAAFDSRFAFIALLIVQGLACLLVCIYIDTRSLRAPDVGNMVVAQVNEEDVIAEANRVVGQGCTDSVKTQNLCKQYTNGFMAVKGTSFGIDKGQVFGLLGPNGAGKSTTFNMITSRLKPTNGQIFLQNQVAEKGNSELYQNVGICPQFDCLWELMTPVEHLRIFALVKGLKGHKVEEAMEYFMRIMQLDAFRKTKAGNLSGGNKRKLCVAIALIGSPSMQFFDEPSSGVDPIARRFLWNTINQGLRINSSAVVLTTHSMDEAESLCHKIGIQINGQFVCMGSPQHLKSKYGQGYQITLEAIGDRHQIIRMVQERFPMSVNMQSKMENQVVFQFPTRDFSFYETFDFFLNTLQTKQQLIKDFEIVQSTLEQVFMYFASFQEVRPENAFQPRKQGMFHACTGNDEDD